MKKLQDEVMMTDIYHTIKSPIVSIKSMLFVLGRNKDVQKNKVLQDKVSQIEGKINVLHKRLEIFLNYIFYKEGVVEFLYSFFNLDEVIEEVVKKINSQQKSVRFSFVNQKQQPIMADCDQIKEAVRIILTRVSTKSKQDTISIMVSSSGKTIVVLFRYRHVLDDLEKKPIHSDEECVACEEDYIAKRIIAMHGGHIDRTSDKGEVTVRIILPMKAKPSSRKK